MYRDEAHCLYLLFTCFFESSKQSRSFSIISLILHCKLIFMYETDWSSVFYFLYLTSIFFLIWTLFIVLCFIVLLFVNYSSLKMNSEWKDKSSIFSDVLTFVLCWKWQNIQTMKCSRSNIYSIRLISVFRMKANLKRKSFGQDSCWTDIL